MKPTEELLLDYADMICEFFGEDYVAELAINIHEDAGTSMKKLMLFNIKLAQRFDESITDIYNEIMD